MHGDCVHARHYSTQDSWVLDDSVTAEERGSSPANILCCHANLINAICLGGPIILVDIELISMIQS
jgi:hypothetical protein